jgi:hypothetical protein
MARTLLELFKTMPIGSSGKTAEETYGVRNSKDIGIQTNSVILNNSSVYGINLVRRTLGVSRGESVAEQELTGIRPLYTISSPYIYGTDVVRINSQRTSQVEKMKTAGNGGGGTEGVISGLTSQITGKIQNVAESKLGAKFPSDLNPTSYYERLNVKNKSDTPRILAEIKGDSSGNIVGKLLSQPQTPSQLVKGAAGEAVGFLKNKVRGKLFGERSTTGFAEGDRRVDTPTQTINYGSDSGINLQTRLGDVIDAGGTTYSKTITKSNPIDVDTSTPLVNKLDFVDGEVDGEFSLANKTPSVLLNDVTGERKVKPEKYDELNTRNQPIANPTFGDVPLPNVEFSKLDPNGDNEYSLYKKSLDDDKIAKIQDFEKTRGFANEIRNYLDIKSGSKKLIQRGLKEKTRLLNGRVAPNQSEAYGDVINESGVFDNEITTVDDLDFIPLKFTLLYNKKTIHFRSVIDGVSETFSPSWDSAKFIGNPFNYYTYSGIERSVGFNLKVMANSANELKRNWERLSFLSSLTYPGAYQSSTSYIIPPFIKFTLGDMYKGKEGFIESLSYTMDDAAGWEIGLNRGMENYKLPKKIDVSITVKFVESRSNTSDYKKLYSFKSVT